MKDKKETSIQTNNNDKDTTEAIADTASSTSACVYLMAIARAGNQSSNLIVRGIRREMLFATLKQRIFINSL